MDAQTRPNAQIAAVPAARRAGLTRVASVLALLLPVFATGALYLPSGLFAPVRLTIVALGGLALVRVIQRPGLLLNPVLWVVAVVTACFAGFGVVGGLRHPQLTSWIELVHVLFAGLATTAMVILGRHPRVVLGLAGGWLLAFIGSAGVGVWETLTGRHLSVNAPARRFGQLSGWNSISAFFDNPNLYAYQLAVVFPLLVLAWSIARSWWQRLLVVGLMALVGQQLVMTGGRVAMGVVAATVVLLVARSRRGQLALAGAAIGLGLAVALRLGPALALWQSVLTAYREGSVAGRSTWVRVRLTQAGWHMAAESGWLGVGPGGFSSLAILPTNPYRTRHWGGHSNAHWGMTEVVADYGLITLIVLVVALGLGVILCWRSSTRGVAGSGPWSFERLLPAVVATQLALVPLVSMSHSTWLRQPLTAVHLATLVALVALVQARRRA